MEPVNVGIIGLGNVGRNTTIVRSNYFTPQNVRFFEASLKLWERFEQELNFNAMVSQRGTLNLYHSDGQRDLFARRANGMRLEGVDAEKPVSDVEEKPKVVENTGPDPRIALTIPLADGVVIDGMRKTR